MVRADYCGVKIGPELRFRSPVAERSVLTDKFGYSETDDLLPVRCFS